VSASVLYRAMRAARYADVRRLKYGHASLLSHQEVRRHAKYCRRRRAKIGPAYLQIILEKLAETMQKRCRKQVLAKHLH